MRGGPELLSPGNARWLAAIAGGGGVLAASFVVSSVWNPIWLATGIEGVLATTLGSAIAAFAIGWVVSSRDLAMWAIAGYLAVQFLPMILSAVLYAILRPAGEAIPFDLEGLPVFLAFLPGHVAAIFAGAWLAERRAG